jgi:pilus assembly protein CpaB
VINHPVVVAAAPISRGVAVDAPLLKVVDYPGVAPVGAFSTITQVIGDKAGLRVAMRGFAPDEVILAGALTAPGGKLSLAGILSPGMQAVSLRTNDITDVAGFVLPGDRVDILLSRTIGGGQNTPGNPVTQVLAQNIRVVGVDQVDDQQASNPMVVRAVTVEVSPAQAQTLTLAQTVGTLSLTLRHVDDAMPQTRRSTQVADLGFGSPAEPHVRGVTGPVGPSVRITRVTDTTVFPLSMR